MANVNVTKSKLEIKPFLFGEIAFVPGKTNLTRFTPRGDKDKERLTYQLAAQGWIAQKGVIPCFNSKSPIWGPYKFQDAIDLYYKMMVDKYERLLNGEDAVAVAVFEAMHVKSGKVIKPTMLANAAHGRGEVYFESQVLRAKGFVNKETTEEFEPAEIVAHVPVELEVYNSEVERVRHQIDENAKNDVFVPPSDPDKLRTLAFFFQEAFPFTQAEARRMYPGTTGQKGWLFIRLNQLWSSTCPEKDLFEGETKRPNLGLLNRALLKPGQDGYISFKSLNNVGLLGEMIARSSKEGLAKKNEEIKERNNKRSPNEDLEPILHPISAEEVESEMANPTKKNQGKGTDTMPKDQWEAVANSDNKLLQRVAQAHLKSDPTELRKMSSNAGLYNRVLELQEAGKTELMLLALAVMEHEKFMDFATAVRAKRDFEIVIVNEEEAATDGQMVPNG